ncbi:hypothetical protein thsps21_37160 [Pseudomonas sp. No.21]|jgi:hypothetical protein|uniref:hypothetical protein n=1 Tax=Pseudomonas TaxID=286 RepID=UPI000DAA4325|nr:MULTISPECIES: hypothetical protein [Pseudomonas]MDW3713403.1 hypothetical protein [Pseudomonas sp. 2023EL-01195]PZE10677.1 hypothetical protein DMX10_24805 [Pseudomonas sp. 57B-090624]GJN45603.1 hypothetical protein TUM20249_15890 [Pseudomonas tohonis]
MITSLAHLTLYSPALADGVVRLEPRAVTLDFGLEQFEGWAALNGLAGRISFAGAAPENWNRTRLIELEPLDPGQAKAIFEVMAERPSIRGVDGASVFPVRLL